MTNRRQDNPMDPLPQRFSRISIFVIFLMVLVACESSEAPSSQGDCSSALGKEHINIGVVADQPGWNYQGSDYSRSGFDYDFANWLGLQLCFTPTFVEVTHGQREDYIINGRVRLVIASFSKTDDRAERVSFAAPYVINRQGVMVQAGDGRISRLEDLNGKAVCTASGTTSLDELQEAHSLRITIIQFPGMGECVDALQKGLADAVSTDQLVLYGMSKDDPELFVVPDLIFGNQERYGIGFRHGDGETCSVLKKEIHEFIAGGHWDNFFESNLPNVKRRDQYRPDPNLLDRCP